MSTEEFFGGSFNISGAHDKIDGGDMEKRGGGVSLHIDETPQLLHIM